MKNPFRTEKRAPFSAENARFSTQRKVTYILLGVFIGLVINVLSGTDQAERSTVIQTVINLVVGAVGFWLGSSKAEADSKETLNKIVQPQSESMSRMAEKPSALGASPEGGTQVENMEVTAENVDLTEKKT